jgi:hypothetical protein
MGSEQILHPSCVEHPFSHPAFPDKDTAQGQLEQSLFSAGVGGLATHTPPCACDEQGLLRV